MERLRADIARGSDGLLDFAVLAFGVWTVVYHVCVVVGIGVLGAGIAWVVGLIPAAWLAFGYRYAEPPIPEPARAPALSRTRRAVLVGGYAVVAAASAAVYAYADLRWSVTWLLLLLAAAGGAVLTYYRATGQLRLSLLANGERRGPGAFAAVAWAGTLAVLSLYLVRPDGDDTQYVHLSTWIAEHGEFPLRDTLYSNQVFPAIFYPPLSSFEALIGSVANAFGFSAPGMTYLVVSPVATALGVLALWRLLRTWRAPMVALALSTALVFLLMAAQEHQTLGNLFVGRIWQGKIVFLVVLVPLLFVLLQAFAEQPTWKQGVLLVAAGASAVGLTSSGAFLVPVLALGCLAPLALRSVGQAATGFLAASAYPLGSLAVTAVVGQRTASEFDVVTGEIARFVLGSGFFAFVAVGASLVGPVLIASRRAALMAGATVLLVVVLFAPPVPPLIGDITGIGRVLWRLVWIVPVAALAGVVATSVPARIRSPALRAVPAVVICAVLIVWGSPVWDAATVESRPSWKRPPQSIDAARQILERAEPGDIVLAPSSVSQTILIMSADVTTVSPRVFYTLALRDEPEAHVDERTLLQSIVEPRVAERTRLEPPDDAGVARAATLVGVDVACVENRRTASLQALEAAGYSPTFRPPGLTCLEPA